MIKLSIKFFWLIIITSIFWSCTNETEVFPVDFGYDYFPLEVGKYRIYEVDSVTYDPQLSMVVIDSTTSQIKEEITGTLVDNTGATVFRVERSTRRTAGDPWIIKKIFVQSRDESRAFQVEDNLRSIKMVFPLAAGKEWNGNVFFDSTEIIVMVAGETLDFFKDWSWQILEVGIPVNTGGMDFEAVTTIQLADSENLIERRKAVEQYALGVGLIYREMAILDTQCQYCCDADFAQCGGLAWEEKAEKGFTIRQRLIEHN